MDMEQYYNKMTDVILDGFKRINMTDKVEREIIEVPSASWEVKVVRGDVMEKATVSRAKFQTKHPYTGEDTTFHALQATVYPASPKIPILVFIIEHMKAADDFFSGMMDVIPAVPIEEDLRFMGAEMKKVADKHGEDYETLREKGAKMFKIPLWEKPINAGVGIHNPTVKERVDMIKEEGEVWMKAYFDVVEKRMNEPYNTEDEALMNSVRSHVMEYYYVGDISLAEGQKIGITLEMTNLALLAPTLRY